MDSLASFDLEPSFPKDETKSQLAIVPIPEKLTEIGVGDEQANDKREEHENNEERRFVFVDSPEQSDEARWLRRLRTPMNVGNWQMVPDIWKNAAGSFNKVAAPRNYNDSESNLSEEGIHLDGIDFLGPADAIKNLAELPYSDRPFSMALHRMGRTLVVDAHLEEPTHHSHWESDANPSQHADQSPFMGPARNLPDQPEGSYLPEEERDPCNPPTDANPLSNVSIERELSESLVEPPRPFYVPPAPKPLMKLYQWQLDEMKLALTSNLLACVPGEGADHPEVNIKVVRPGERLTQCTCLDYYLENVIANIPELALCLRNRGYIQSYKLVKTEEIPFLNANGGVDVDLPPIFDPKAVEMNASMLLRFLQENCQQEGRTYILHREENGGAVQLYDLTALSKERLRKWKWLLAMLCYRFALRISQHIRLVDTTGRTKLLNRQRQLLSTCLDLLHELACMGGGRHETICAAVQEHIADSYLEPGEESYSPLHSPAGTKGLQDFSFNEPRSNLEGGTDKLGAGERGSEDARSTAGLSGTISGASTAGVSIGNLEQAKEHLARGAAILQSLLQTYHQSSTGQGSSESEVGLSLANNLVDSSHEDIIQVGEIDVNANGTISQSVFGGHSSEASPIGSDAQSETEEDYTEDTDARTAVAVKLIAMEEKLMHTCTALGQELLQIQSTDGSIRAMSILAEGMDHWINVHQLQQEYKEAVAKPQQKEMDNMDSMMSAAMTLWELNADCVRTAILWLPGCGEPHSNVFPASPLDPREIIAGLSPFLAKAEAFRLQLVPMALAQPEFGASSHIDWGQLDVCELVHTTRPHKEKRQVTFFPCLGTRLNEVSNETGLTGALVQWKAQVACVICYRLALFCSLETKDSQANATSKSLMLKIGGASNEVGKLLSQFIKGCLSKTPHILDQLHFVIPTCMATCIAWFEEALQIFVKVGPGAQSHAALACLNLASVVKLQTKLNSFLPTDPKTVERWFLRSLELCARGHTVLGVRTEGGPNCRLWDMLSEEAAMAHLALGLHRKRQLPKVEASSGHTMKCSPPEERNVVQPLETALRIYKTLNNLSQIAAVNYQLGAFYMATWKNQATISKQESYFNTALSHMHAAYLYFSEQEKGSTYLIILTDLSELHLQAPDSSPTAYIGQLTHCISLILECDRIEENGFFEKRTNNNNKNRVLTKLFEKLTQLLHQILKYLLKIQATKANKSTFRIEEDMTSEVNLFKKLYKESIGIRKQFDEINTQQGMLHACKYLIKQMKKLKGVYNTKYKG